jgi:hypothetical protein
MNPRIRQLSATLSLLAATALTTPTIHAEYRCDRPQGLVDQRACAKAAEGPDALRHFVERTRMIYQLYIWDYVRPDGSAGKPL